MSSGRAASRSRAARALLFGALSALLGSACSSAASPLAQPSRATSNTPVSYSFAAVGDDAVVSSETMRGRATALLFITTYDLASQLLARRLGDVIARFTPRANAAAVVVEPPAYAELLPAYREALSLPYPVVMADFATQRGAGPFGGITQVPVLVILDREGRQTWRHDGALETQAIEAALRAALR
jgi:hypothetical protein